METNEPFDPIDALLLSGKADTVADAERIYLDAAYPEALSLLAGPLSNRELADHPLMRLYRMHGSRGWEDSL